jgi:erythromycin esterase-like protein
MLDATLPIISDLVREAAHPLTGSQTDYDHLLEFIGDARLVLLGEASHGTHEFYRERARITKRLILEKGFTGIAVEADWPDAYRVNCYVQGENKDADAVEALSGFRRFPAWMWRNADVLDFVGWLRPESELTSHYFGAQLSDQFDAVIHFDQTRAVEPLEPIAEQSLGELAETFPSGI